MGNNPVRYVDPDGRIIDTIWDIVCTVYDIGAAVYKSLKGDNSGWVDVVVDAAAIIIPAVPAGLSKIDDTVKAVKAIDKATATASSAATIINNIWGNLEKAGEYGIKIYSELRKFLANTGLQAHHIIEQRFLPALQKLGLTANKMLAVAVTPEEHQKFTNAWRSAFAYGTDYANLAISEIWNAAQQIYAEYPELLKAAAQTLGIE